MTSTARAQVSIALPRQKVWEGLRDLGRAPFYVPGLTGVEFTTERREGVGASRKVLQKSRPPMDETVVRWDEGYGFVLRLHNGDKPPAPFREASFEYRIADAPDGGTLFQPALTYTLPWGVFGALLDALIVNRFGRGQVRAVALNFKRYYETGEIPNPAFRPDVT